MLSVGALFSHSPRNGQRAELAHNQLSPRSVLLPSVCTLIASILTDGQGRRTTEDLDTTARAAP